MQTFTGRQFWPMAPRSDDVCLEDIAHSLANQCRFGGHCQKFYSIAQHSVLVARAVPLADRPWGLLHDSPEAYLVDLPRPIKHHSVLGKEYRLIEDPLVQVIGVKYNLAPVMPASVHHADDVLLMTEKRDLLGPCAHDWESDTQPLATVITPWPPELAEYIFLSMAKELGITDGATA